MAGVDTILRLIGGTVAILAIIFIAWVAVMLIDPLFNNLTFGDLPADWGSPQNVVYLFATLSFVGLLAVVVIWWLVAPIRDDVRQEVQRGPPF